MIKHIGKVIDKIAQFDVLNCTTCGFIHINPIPSFNDLKKIYSSEYYTEEKPKYIVNNLKDKQWWETVYNDRLDYLDSYNKSLSKKLLELGSGPGLFLKFMKNNGWDVTGIEPSKEAASFAKKYKISIVEDFYGNVEMTTLGNFDAVVMYEFLEHVPNPNEVIEVTSKILKKGGIISIGVPNDYNPLQEIAMKSLNLKPYWLAPPYHINYFSIKSLRKLLEKHDFKILHEETNFPMELFILMGDNYITQEKLGRRMHAKRKKFDITLSNYNNQLKRDLYKKLASLNLGRDITLYAEKI